MSTVLSPADVDRIAALARLELTDDERARFATQLTAILAYADQVQQVDTSTIAEAAAAPDARMRDDALLPSLDRELSLSQAPAADRAAGLFKVPRVLGS
jgi:aspartyl-tRNA(Asn)/glutamyl-tRNA(Gln) amidotransferase subunit C